MNQRKIEGKNVDKQNSTIDQLFYIHIFKYIKTIILIASFNLLAKFHNNEDRSNNRFNFSAIHLLSSHSSIQSNIPVLGWIKHDSKSPMNPTIPRDWLISLPRVFSFFIELVDAAVWIDEWQWQICSPLSKQLRRQPVQRDDARFLVPHSSIIIECP